MEEPTNSSQRHPPDRIKLNVGGRLFETTTTTALSGGTDSLLASLSLKYHHNDPVFIDRDPDIFSSLLSILRSSALPSSTFSLQHLLEEASFYGVESSLKSALAPPPLSGIDASLASTLLPASHAFLSAFDEQDSLWMAHGGQISTYDSLLIHSSTIRTHLDEISSICRVTPSIAAIGSQYASGSTFWTDSSDPRIFKSTVSALCESKEGGGSCGGEEVGEMEWMEEREIMAVRVAEVGIV